MAQYLLNLVIAGIIGFVIGIISIREDNASSGRVFAIICMGSALITITSIGFYQSMNLPWTGDPARMPAQLISALGFLGTGMIWITNDKRVVGMTNAALLWITAILGMLIGAGLNQLSVLGIFFIVLIYWLSHLIKKHKATSKRFKR